MCWTRGRCWALALLLALSAAGASAHAQIAAEPGTTEPGVAQGESARKHPLPLAERDGARPPRTYPSVDVAVGVRSIHPDFGGLAKAYQGTPAIELSPIASAMLAVAMSEAIAIRLDAGISMATDTFSQAMAGIVYSLPAPAGAWLRPFVGAGGTWFSIQHLWHGDIQLSAAATGAYVTAGVAFVLGSVGGLEVYGGYCRYPRVTTDFEDWERPNERIEASLDLSSPILGLRLGLSP